MAKYQGAVLIDTERCKGCGLCVAACPRGIVSIYPNRFNRQGYKYAGVTSETACSGCASCAIICPDGCITVYRAKED